MIGTLTQFYGCFFLLVYNLKVLCFFVLAEAFRMLKYFVLYIR